MDKSCVVYLQTLCKATCNEMIGFSWMLRLTTIISHTPHDLRHSEPAEFTGTHTGTKHSKIKTKKKEK